MTTGDWNAASYDKVADPQARWGAEVLERLPLVGDETVLDAGCGTGRVTELLLARLPKGRVVALDAGLPVTVPGKKGPLTVDSGAVLTSSRIKSMPSCITAASRPSASWRKRLSMTGGAPGSVERRRTGSACRSSTAT